VHKNTFCAEKSDFLKPNKNICMMGKTSEEVSIQSVSCIKYYKLQNYKTTVPYQNDLNIKSSCLVQYLNKYSYYK
jgi:hypothetical protein